MQITTAQALEKLANANKQFIELFTHGTLSVEIYKPTGKDLQLPHDKDEIYVVISGSGEFDNGGKNTKFQTGDLLFVPAGVAHHFENFTSDFSTWVIFYGPAGGEKNI